MTNEMIIYNAAVDHGFTTAQLDALLVAYKGELPFHTFQGWKKRGYSVKKGEHALFRAELWRFTNKVSKALAESMKKEGQDAPEDDPHYYKKLSFLFSREQVEEIRR